MFINWIYYLSYGVYLYSDGVDEWWGGFPGGFLCRDLAKVSEEDFKKLEELSSKYPEVVFLAITGSIARKGFSIHDVDVAVKLSAVKDRYEVLTSILTDISEILKVPEECIDLIDLDRADPEV